MWGKDNEEDIDEDEEDVELSESQRSNDKIIFLIDARTAMFEKNSAGEIKLCNCLKLALETMKSKIIADDKSNIGVIFFGTRVKDKDGIIDGVYTLFNPEAPSAGKIRLLKYYHDNIQAFHNDIGSQNETATISSSSMSGSTTSSSQHTHRKCPLREALWVCSQAFRSTSKASSSKNHDYKRIWIFTNDDHPNQYSILTQKKTIQVAKDCAETGVEISLFHMDSNQYGVFNINKFYKKLLLIGLFTNKKYSQYRRNQTQDQDDEYDVEEEEDGGDREYGTRHHSSHYKNAELRLTQEQVEEEENDTLEMRIQSAGNDNFDTMLVYARQKIYHKRRLSSFYMTFGSETKISLNMYKLYTITKKPTFKLLYAQTNEPVYKLSKWIDGDTGEMVTENNIDYYLELGGNNRIPCNTAEYQTIKKGAIPTSTSLTSSSTANKEKMHPLSTIATTSSMNTSTPTPAVTSVYTPGIQILYYIPKHLVLPEWNVETSYFIYPENQTIQNSSSLYQALLYYLHTHHKVAVVKFIRSMSSIPRIGVLIPSTYAHRHNTYRNSTSDSNNNERTSDEQQHDSNDGVDEYDDSHGIEGLHLVILPYLEDIRHNPDALKSDILKMMTSDILTAASQVVNMMTFKSHFEYWNTYESPAIQQFYSVLQAIALSESQTEWKAAENDNLHFNPMLLELYDKHHRPVDIEDESLHETQKRDIVEHHIQHIQQVISDYQSICGLNENVLEEYKNSTTKSTSSSYSRKRAVPTDDTAESSSTSRSKKTSSPTYTEQELTHWKQMKATNTLGKMTVAELKDICHKMNLGVSGNKSQLVGRIENSL